MESPQIRFFARGTGYVFSALATRCLFTPRLALVWFFFFFRVLIGYLFIVTCDCYSFGAQKDIRNVPYTEMIKRENKGF